MYFTLEDVQYGRANLTPQQLQDLRVMLAKGLKLPRKKERAMTITQDIIRKKPPFWAYPRLLFYPDGRIQYADGWDGDNEWGKLRDTLLDDVFKPQTR